MGATDEKTQPHKAVDPTANVIALVEANAKAAEKLREADNKFYDEQNRHVKELAELRAQHAGELNTAESKRIDAVRVIDVGAVATAAERAAQQATVLANQLSTNAETLRALVATTAAATAATTASAMASITTAAAQFQAQVTERLQQLERSQYKGEGRSGLADPQMAELLNEMRSLGRTQATSQGSSGGMQTMGGWIVAGVTLLIALVGFFATKI